MKRISRWIIFILLIACLPLSACGKAPASAKKEVPSKLDPVPGRTDVKKVTLTEKAAKRLDIQSVTVGNGVVDRKQVISGEVVENPLLEPTQTAKPEPSASSDQAWVRAGFSSSDLMRIDRKKSVAIRPAALDAQALSLPAEEVEVPAAFQEGEGDTSFAFYMIKSGAKDLTVGQRVGVEFPLLQNGSKRIVIPYAAVIYDQTGATWVYTNPESLVFVRRPIIVDYIDGDQAYLVVGPPTGTKIVVVGSAELYGAETGVSK